MADTLQVVIFRQSNEERTCAVVHCQRTDGVSSGNTLRAALIRALTRWMKRTPEGRTALECSAEYFNIGDLMNELPEPTLEPFLTAAGVNGLEVEVYSGEETDWDFDDLLFDERALAPTAGKGTSLGSSEGDCTRPGPG